LIRLPDRRQPGGLRRRLCADVRVRPL